MSWYRFLRFALCLTCSLVLGCWTLTSTAQVLQSSAPAGITKLNHIIFMVQENRSLDHYFGELRKYWADNGYSDRSFDGLPQFNPTTGLPPYYGPPPTNPGCDPADPPPKDCTIDRNSPQIASFE